MDVSRRTLMRTVPAAGLAGLLSTWAAASEAAEPPGSLYRVDDEVKILAAAKAMFAEDRTGTLVTVDSSGVPRVRPVA